MAGGRVVAQVEFNDGEKLANIPLDQLFVTKSRDKLTVNFPKCPTEEHNGEIITMVCVTTNRIVVLTEKPKGKVPVPKGGRRWSA